MRTILAVLTLSVVACSQSSETVEDASKTDAAGDAIDFVDSAPPRLEPHWVLTGLSAPEGVAAHPDGGYFISNVSGEGDAKDGDGWISIVSEDGEFIAEKWVEGLDAPKGMAIKNGVLYVSDIDQVRTYEIQSGTPGEIIPIEGARFLNDVAIWQGEIFVADSGTGRIWRLEESGPVIWREGEDLGGVNGLLGAGDKMFVTTMNSGSLFEANMNGGWRELASGMIDADGVAIVPSSLGGGFLVTSWPGEIHYVAPDGEVTSLLNTREQGAFQNDLSIFGDVVIVPNWMPGTLTAWKLSRPAP